MGEEIEKNLREEFSNYERTVWVVNSIEGHLQQYYKDLVVYFDRYPVLNCGDKELTPDFTVVFNGPYEIVGEVKRALGRTDQAIEANYEQLKNYDRKLKFRVTDGDGYHHESAKHDIVLFINIEYARRESRRLVELLKEDRKNCTFTRAVSVFSATNDIQAARGRWVFLWEPHTDKLTDSKLPQGKRLSERHQNAEDPIIIYPDAFAGIQAVHRFCNDAPPVIYVAVILWSKIFPRMLTRAQREKWTLDADCIGTVDIEITVDSAIEATRRFVSYGIKRALMKRVLELFAKAKFAEKKGDEKFIIHFRKLRAAGSDDHEGEERKLDHVKEALIRALCRGERPSGGRVKLPRRRRGSGDSRQINLL